jgi:2,3-bisphosphoglycerate-independent phosphoglycerate mutase
MKAVKPVALIIMDGWGLRTMETGNAVILATTPNYDRMNATLERSVLDASGLAVGLPEGQMGNSEVGHLNLGAGRIVYQDLTRINLAISDRSFFANPVLVDAVQKAKRTGKKLHLIGLFSDGGVHSHIDHLFALLALAGEYSVEPVIHLITDGRDTPPESGATFVAQLEKQLAKTPALVASVTGRYYTMDRDKRWPRIELGYRAMVHHEGKDGATAPSAAAALAASYAAGVSDEFVLPVAIETGDKRCVDLLQLPRRPRAPDCGALCESGL